MSDGDLSPEAEAEVAAILAELRPVVAANATWELIASGTRGLELLAGADGSPRWAELVLKVAAMLCEVPQGDRADNVNWAFHLYARVLELEPPAGTREEARLGLVAAMCADPAPEHAAFDLAIDYTGQLVDEVAAGDDEGLRASALIGYAAALEARPYGDRGDAVERALAAQLEAVELLRRRANGARSLTLGRALHDLGRYHLARMSGVRSDNLDAAVLAFYEAVELTPAELDPTGRARTLWALAGVVGGRSGAESLRHADELARSARAEALTIVPPGPGDGSAIRSWADLRWYEPALNADLDAFDRLGPEDIAASLDLAVATHRAALAVIPAETMPVDWARWQGGLSRLLSQYHLRFGVLDHTGEAVDGFEAALERVDPTVHPRLWRDLQRRLGELTHAMGDWQRSQRANTEAVGVCDQLYELTALPEHRMVERTEARALALLASYAAARLGDRAEAVRLAERGCSRSQVDGLLVAKAALEASPDVREEVGAAWRRVVELEARLRVEAADPGVEIWSKLVDFLGPGAAERMGFRYTSDEQRRQANDPAAARRRELSAQLDDARRKVDRLLLQVQQERPDLLEPVLSAADVVAIVARAGWPLLYLLPTFHGCMVLIVMEDAIRTLHIDGFTSDVSTSMAHGGPDGPGLMRGAHYGDAEALGPALERCLPALEMMMAVVTGCLENDLGVTRAALVPLGSLGLLPVVAAASAASPGLVCHQVVSARFVGHGLDSRRGAQTRSRRLFAVADPPRDGQAPLIAAPGEVQAIAALFGRHGVPAEIVGDVEPSVLLERAAAASHVHFACHAHFRPSYPLASAIAASTSADLTLGDVFESGTALSGVELVVLSACQTAAREWRLVDESIGFPAALLAAGAAGVLCTAWPVADDAAAVFCIHFYRRLLDGADPAAAAAATRRWLRQADVAQVRELVKEARAAAPGGLDVARSFTAITERLPMRHQAAPFGAAQDWAAFVYFGV